jgi:hypothetical protein
VPAFSATASILVPPRSMPICMAIGVGPIPSSQSPVVQALRLDCYMTKPTKPEPRPLFTPSTLPKPSAPDPVVVAIEDALLAIANRQEATRAPKPAA